MTLTPLTSDDLTVPHGFFTRQGGASSGVYSSLNCGLGSTDQRDMVMINRARIAETMGVKAEHLMTVHQTHSIDVATVKSASDTGSKADAMVTNQPGFALGIMTADCQPLLFADAENRVIGAAHAGWKGALYGILEATVEAMEQLGAEREKIAAVIGPCISQRAYEVGPEYLDQFLDEDPEYSRFFANGQDGKYQFDLVGFGLSQLRQTGIKSASWIGHCTYSDPDRFFSYRRSVHQNEADYGRLLSVIRL